MKSISEELTEIKIDELQKLETYLERLRIFNQSYKKVSDLDRERINKIIPSENDYEDLVISVEDIIKNRGLILNSVTINSDEQASGASRSRAVPKSTTSTALSKGVKEIVLNLSVSETDYMTMKNLISDFEKNLRLMDIKNVSYSDGEGVSLVLSAYYYSL
ncbi:MAG: hypothetical protein PF572_06680 [Patescibacteria group bacterium]|nr:hypothetical protein [Patescibacteria group bacterium]